MRTDEKIPQVYYSSKLFVGRERHNCADMFAVSHEEQQQKNDHIKIAPCGMIKVFLIELKKMLVWINEQFCEYHQSEYHASLLYIFITLTDVEVHGLGDSSLKGHVCGAQFYLMNE